MNVSQNLTMQPSKALHNQVVKIVVPQCAVYPPPPNQKGGSTLACGLVPIRTTGEKAKLSSLHCKKWLAVFMSSRDVTYQTYSPRSGIIKLFPPRVGLVSHPGWGRENREHFFYSVSTFNFLQGFLFCKFSPGVFFFHPKLRLLRHIYSAASRNKEQVEQQANVIIDNSATYPSSFLTNCQTGQSQLFLLLCLVHK